MNRQVNGVIRIVDKIQCDKTTKEWFEQHPDARTTVTVCEKCGLWYKPSLGHECEKE